MKNACLILWVLIGCLTLTAGRFSTAIHDSRAKAVSSSGNLRTEERTVGEFTEMLVSNGIEVFITEGSSKKLKVCADEAYLPYIQTELSGQTLLVGIKSDVRLKSKTKIKVYAEMEKIRELASTSGAAIRSVSPLTAADISLQATSGSCIDLKLTAVRTDLSISSGAAISLKGKAGVLDASASSGSQLSASELSVDSGNITLSSGSQASVKVSDNLAYSVASGSHLICSGSPQITSARVSSGGLFSRR